MPTTQNYAVEVWALYRFHRSRMRDKQLPEHLRIFHKVQAKEISQRIEKTKHLPWTWERFIEAYKGK
jgi:hypothetical protein